MLVKQQMTFNLYRYNFLYDQTNTTQLTTFSVWTNSRNSNFEILFKHGYVFNINIEQLVLENLFKTYLSLPTKQDSFKTTVCVYEKSVAHITNSFIIDKRKICLINHELIRNMIQKIISGGYSDFSQGIVIEKELSSYE